MATINDLPLKRGPAEASGGCPGCAEVPLPACAACGKPAVRFTRADRFHLCSWCAACFKVRQELRAEAARYTKRPPTKKAG